MWNLGPVPFLTLVDIHYIKPKLLPGWQRLGILWLWSPALGWRSPTGGASHLVTSHNRIPRRAECPQKTISSPVIRYINGLKHNKVWLQEHPLWGISAGKGWALNPMVTLRVSVSVGCFTITSGKYAVLYAKGLHLMPHLWSRLSHWDWESLWGRINHKPGNNASRNFPKRNDAPAL